MLTWIKLLHTAVWLFMVACIACLPILALQHRFRAAALLTGIVLAECGVLAANRGRCPLTDLAARYTEDRADNFDIYLPLLVARHNKRIFGTIFVLDLAVVLWQWLAPRP